MDKKGHQPFAGARRKVTLHPELLVVSMNFSKKERIYIFKIYEQNIIFSENILSKIIIYCKLQDIKLRTDEVRIS